MIDATAKWVMSEEHYQMHWNDWLKSVSRWRKYTIPYGLAFLTVGFLSLLLGRDFWIFSFVAILIGSYNLLWHYWNRSRWFTKIRSGVSADEEVMIRFLDEKILVSGPTSKGEMQWRTITRAVSGQHGVFIWLQRGSHIYIPWDALTPENAWSEILERIDQN